MSVTERRVDLSCVLPAAPQVPELIALAEQLGYRNAYCFDSPAICMDVYVTLARAAERTSRIGIGAGVAVPGLRHPATTAAALLTLELLAPGRVIFGVGTGFTGALLVGGRAMSWSKLIRYVQTVRELLAGGEAEWSGERMRLQLPPELADALPVSLPVLVAADGPKGRAAAARLAAGLCSPVPQEHHRFDWVAQPINGTVLRDGESRTSDRAFAAAGPGIAIAYHLAYEKGGAAAVAALPEGQRFAEMVEAMPEETRRYALHDGHGRYLNQLDRAVLPREVVAELTLTGSAREVASRLDALAEGGVSEVMYSPCGPDLGRELTEFARAAALAPVA